MRAALNEIYEVVDRLRYFDMFGFSAFSFPATRSRSYYNATTCAAAIAGLQAAAPTDSHGETLGYSTIRIEQPFETTFNAGGLVKNHMFRPDVDWPSAVEGASAMFTEVLMPFVVGATCPVYTIDGDSHYWDFQGPDGEFPFRIGVADEYLPSNVFLPYSECVSRGTTLLEANCPAGHAETRGWPDSQYAFIEPELGYASAAQWSGEWNVVKYAPASPISACTVQFTFKWPPQISGFNLCGRLADAWTVGVGLSARVRAACRFYGTPIGKFVLDKVT